VLRRSAGCHPSVFNARCSSSGSTRRATSSPARAIPRTASSGSEIIPECWAITCLAEPDPHAFRTRSREPASASNLRSPN
jgi:hypothetical protein